MPRLYQEEMAADTIEMLEKKQLLVDQDGGIWFIQRGFRKMTDSEKNLYQTDLLPYKMPKKRGDSRFNPREK